MTVSSWSAMASRSPSQARRCPRSRSCISCRVKKNSVAYLPPVPPDVPKRGRPRVYGDKLSLRSLFDDSDSLQLIDSPVYGETGVQILVHSADLLWRPLGILVRFVVVIHPSRGRCILMSTDCDLSPVRRR